MHSPHHLTAMGFHPGGQQQSIELDTFVPQRITLIDIHHGRRKSCNIVDSCKPRAGDGVFLLQILDAVTHRNQVRADSDEDTVVIAA